MSRSPIPCPRCGAALADRRRRGSAAVRPDVEVRVSRTKAATLLLTCPDCGALLEWEQKKVVIYDVRAAKRMTPPNNLLH